MIDFDVRKFGSTFTENKVNGFDVMIMQSHEDADKLIDVVVFPTPPFWFTIDIILPITNHLIMVVFLF